MVNTLKINSIYETAASHLRSVIETKSDIVQQEKNNILPLNTADDLRKIIIALMPELRLLRNSGFSFDQISELLGQCEIYVSTASLEFLFQEQILELLDNVSKQVNEQLVTLAKLMKPQTFSVH